MTWLSMLTALLKFVAALATWLGQRELLRAGEAQALARGLAATLSALEEVRLARAALVDPDERRRLRDRFTRLD